MRWSVQRGSWFVAFVVATFAGVAKADIVVPEPKRDACSGKADNDACELEGKPGTCKKQTCSRKVGGVLNPHYVDEDCLLCDLAPQGATKSDEPKPSPTPAKTDPAKAEPVAPTEPEPAKAEPADAEPAKAEPANAEPAKAEPAKAEPAKSEADKRGICSVSTEATPFASAMLGVVLLVLARPRRR